MQISELQDSYEGIRLSQSVLEADIVWIPKASRRLCEGKSQRVSIKPKDFGIFELQVTETFGKSAGKVGVDVPSSYHLP